MTPEEFLAKREKELNSKWYQTVTFMFGIYRLVIDQNALDYKYEVLIYVQNQVAPGSVLETFLEMLHPFDTFIDARAAGNKWIADRVCTMEGK